MTGLVRKATLFTACGLLVAAVAMAGTPNASNSSHQNSPLRLIGYKLLTIDPAGVFTVTARDIGNNVVGGIPVTIKLGNCTDTHIGTQAYQSGGSVGLTCAACQGTQTVDATNKTITAITNASGVAVFDVVGAINAAAPPTRSPVFADAAKPGCAVNKCAEIWFLGFNVKLDNLQVVAFDQNGANGVDGVDLSYWAVDFFPNAYSGDLRAASDYNAANCVDGVDLSLWAIEFFPPANSVISAAAYAW